jgi:large conductance mechanosensitive channel
LHQDVDARHKACARAGLRPDPSAGHDGAFSGGSIAMLEEFKKFALRGNVVDLAIGVIIGAAFSGIVNSLVGDVIMPIIGAVTGGIDFSNYYVPLSSKVTATTLAEAKKEGAVLAWGNFLTITLNFIIVAFVLFLVIRAINQFSRKEAEKAPTPTKTEELLTEIRDQLKLR